MCLTTWAKRLNLLANFLHYFYYSNWSSLFHMIHSWPLLFWVNSKLIFDKIGNYNDSIFSDRFSMATMAKPFIRTADSPDLSGRTQSYPPKKENSSSASERIRFRTEKDFLLSSPPIAHSLPLEKVTTIVMVCCWFMDHFCRRWWTTRSAPW